MVHPLVCSVIIKAHVLTACDITNKFGTKAAKLKCNPEMYLMTFGKIDDDLSHRNAEQYLEIAVYSKSICITVDELCYETYTATIKNRLTTLHQHQRRFKVI